MIVRQFLIIALLTPAALFAQQRAFTIADLYSLKSVEDPQISSNGKSIAFVVKEDNLREGKTNAEIYVVDADGSNLHRMTNNPASDTSPRWSPDGNDILFVSTRKNGSQLWLMHTRGGEPEQVTDFAGGAASPIWSSDGAHIAFAADVYPECGADNDCNKHNDETRDAGPLRATMADRLMYRHWDSWKEGKKTHVCLLDRRSGKIQDLTPGNFDSPAFSLGESGVALSPDGKTLCVVSNRDSNEAETTNKDLWEVSTSGGNALNLTGANKAFDGSPIYSPDGRSIAYRVQNVPGYEADRFRLAVMDRTIHEIRVLTENFDNWVNGFRWAPDGSAIYFLADVRGHVPLSKVDITSGKITPVLDQKTIDAFDISPDGKWIAYVSRAVGTPRELWRYTIGNKSPVRLTTFNADVERTVDIRPAEEMWITSPTGKKIHTFIVKPHGFDPSRKYPLILNVHGGPQSQWADAFRGDWQVYPGAGYIVAFPNPHGSTGYGQDFTLGISKDWGGKVYDDVMAVADSLAHVPWVDAERMGAMGWSYGGYMMMWFEGHTTRFKAIASMMGVYDLTAMHGGTEELWFPQYDLDGAPWTSTLYQKWSPNLSVKNFKTPCLVITGERDYRVPYTQSLEFFTDLQSMHVPSRLIVFRNDGHWPSGIKSMPFYYNAHLDWFHTYLGGDPAPYDMTRMLRNQAYEK